MQADRSTAEAVAETYYDSSDADRFYEKVWGGEDIHIGLYGPDVSIRQASRKTVVAMADQLDNINGDSRVIDLGAGYGGAARFLAYRYGCHVECLNLSAVQNTRNSLLCKAQDLADKVTVTHGSFEAIPAGDHSVDVVWSQDAFLHSSKRAQVLAEIDRVLKPGGELLFTDPMQADDCPPGVLQEVYQRLSLDSLASFAYYRDALGKLGFEECAIIDLSPQLRNHYAAVKQALRLDYPRLSDSISADYMQRMMKGLENWVNAADAGYLAWGILHFRKPGAD